ncbi:MAG: MATE family efflux transporter [Kineosporiaceae bacterium]
MPLPRASGPDAEILRLAVPALGALVAEPLFLLVDSAVVGRLGTSALAGQGVAAAVLGTLVGLCVFLAYGTTGTVARRLGAGDLRAALSLGLDGVWLSLLLGGVLAVVVGVLAPSFVGWFGSSLGDDAAHQAVIYLRASAAGLPGMLAVLAATGVLRGLQDTRTPLAVAVAGAGLNAVLNVVLVLGVGGWEGMGIAGSGLGTALTQTLMAAALGAVVVRAARAQGVGLVPAPRGVLGSLVVGVPLLVRTLALRATFLVTTWVAARDGDAVVAGHQVATNVWMTLALTLDAIAIAGQAITGRALGAGDVAALRAAVARMVRWGLVVGVVLGLGLAALHAVIGRLFTSDPVLVRTIGAALLVAAVTQPLCGYVFVLDGVLIGAGDGRYLAGAALAQLVLYAPALVWAGAAGGSAPAQLAWLWVALTGWFMLTRAVALGLRARGTGWLRTG